MSYFSDRENIKIHKRLSEHIAVNVWNGIAIIVNSLVANSNFAKDFPKQCPDGNGICGVDEHALYVSAKVVIPTISFLPDYGNIDALHSSYFEAKPFDNECDAKKKKINLIMMFWISLNLSLNTYMMCKMVNITITLSTMS